MNDKTALLFFLAGLAACGSRSGDEPKPTPPPTPLGSGLRIRDVADPGKQGRPAVNSIVNVTGVAVIAVDNFDETRNGKSHGSIFVQDLGSQEPYSGVSLYAPTFVPGDLRVGPGDVLDLTGQYQETAAIGTAKFLDGQVLPQLSRAVGTFRYETASLVAPRVIDVADLADYAKGRRWLGMLVTVQNLEIKQDPATDGSNRVTAALTPADPLVRSPPILTNELYDLKPGQVPRGKKFKSVTGVVTFFFALHLSPRSAADLVP